MCQAAHQASTDKNNLTKKNQFTVLSWSVQYIPLLSNQPCKFSFIIQLTAD